MISAKQARANSNQHEKDFVKNTIAEIYDLIEDASTRGETSISLSPSRFKGPINSVLNDLRAAEYNIQGINPIIISW